MGGRVALEGLRVGDVGEFGLIAILAEALPEEVQAAESLRLGICDDAAVWQPTPGTTAVLTTDSLVQDIHFRLDWTDWESLGHKSLAVNISDLAAMGAMPRLALVTLGLRGDERISDLQELYRGLGSIARRFGMTVAGGDIVRSPQALTLHITAVGEASGGRFLTRSGAKPGEIIGVTGTIGASAAGLRLLELSPDDPRRRSTTAEMLVAAHLRPEPRVALGTVLLEHGASGAMDLSDGLLGDLPKILTASGVAAEIDARQILVAAAVRTLFPDDWLEFALRGGEDYELLFTAPAGAWEEIVRAIGEAGGTSTSIGTVLPLESGKPAIELIGLDGTRQPIRPGAFDHFAHGEA